MVYVDAMTRCLRTARWPWSEACHLYADDEDELHAFARRLKLKQEWFQTANARFHHYDLTSGKRRRAVSLGAVEHSTEEVVAWVHARDRRAERG